MPTGLQLSEIRALLEGERGRYRLAHVFPSDLRDPGAVEDPLSGLTCTQLPSGVLRFSLFEGEGPGVPSGTLIRTVTSFDGLYLALLLGPADGDKGRTEIRRFDPVFEQWDPFVGPVSSAASAALKEREKGNVVPMAFSSKSNKKKRGFG